MKNKSVVLLSVVCLCSIVVMIYSILSTQKKQQLPFEKPTFDKSATVGMPTNTDESYIKIDKEGMGFTAHISGKPIIKDDNAQFNFTNDEENNVWMKLRIFDEDKKVVAETGLIKPGEYIKDVRLNRYAKLGERLSVKIMTYEIDSYCSAGAITINIVL